VHRPQHHLIVTASLERWFHEVDLGSHPTPEAVAVLSELGAMLDTLRPTALDRSRSTIRSSGHGWTLDRSVVAYLAHASSDDGDLEVAVGPEEAIISWSSAHEHLYPEYGTADRPWTTAVIDAVASILRGEYVVEEHRRGERVVKVRVVDIGGGRERVLSTTGSLLSWAPGRRATRVERCAVDYDVDA
jgi:hypothetical protein